MSDYNRNAGPFGAGIARTGSVALDQGLRAYMLGVYNNMAIGLAITGLVAFATFMMAVDNTAGGGRLALTPFGHAIYTGPLKWVLIFAPLGLSMLLNATIDKMSAASARAAFFAFAAAVGVSLSVLLVVFTGASVANAFFVTAAAFAGLSLFGYTTKRDLAPFGVFLCMAGFGVVIASVVGVFLQVPMFQTMISVAAVVVFGALTAYGTQSIKEMYFAGDSREVEGQKSINGALFLYISFLNIFTSIVDLIGDRR